MTHTVQVLLIVVQMQWIDENRFSEESRRHSRMSFVQPHTKELKFREQNKVQLRERDIYYVCIEGLEQPLAFTNFTFPITFFLFFVNKAVCEYVRL